MGGVGARLGQSGVLHPKPGAFLGHPRQPDVLRLVPTSQPSCQQPPQDIWPKRLVSNLPGFPNPARDSPGERAHPKQEGQRTVTCGASHGCGKCDTCRRVWVGSVRNKAQKQRLCLAPPVSTGGCGGGGPGHQVCGPPGSLGSRPCEWWGLCPGSVQADRWPLPWQNLPEPTGDTAWAVVCLRPRISDAFLRHASGSREPPRVRLPPAQPQVLAVASGSLDQCLNLQLLLLMGAHSRALHVGSVNHRAQGRVGPGWRLLRSRGARIMPSSEAHWPLVG